VRDLNLLLWSQLCFKRGQFLLRGLVLGSIIDMSTVYLLIHLGPIFFQIAYLRVHWVCLLLSEEFLQGLPCLSAETLSLKKGKSFLTRVVSQEQMIICVFEEASRLVPWTTLSYQTHFVLSYSLCSDLLWTCCYCILKKWHFHNLVFSFSEPSQNRHLFIIFHPKYSIAIIPRKKGTIPAFNEVMGTAPRLFDGL